MALGYNGGSWAHSAPDLTGLSAYTVHFRVVAITLDTGDFRIAFAADTFPTTPREALIFALCQDGSDLPLFEAHVDNTGASTQGGSSFGTLTWKSIVLTRNGTTARCYIDNVQMGSDVTVGSGTADLTNIRLGCHFFSGSNSQFANCHVADFAIYNTDIGSADRASLAAGASPLLVNPGSLARYYPMIRETDDIVGGTALTGIDFEFPVPHPRVYLATGAMQVGQTGATASVQVTYETEVTVSQDLYANSPHKYSTSAEATAFIDGDFSVNPDQGDEVTYTTEVIVNQAYNSGPPLLVRYETDIVVGQTLTMSDLVAYSTEVLVKQRDAAAIDGRVDLLGTLRYRR